MTNEQLTKVRDELMFYTIPLRKDGFAEAIAILDRELAAPEQEPVGWYCKACRQTGLTHCGDPTSCDGMQRTYLAPPSREWQSLTDEEIKKVPRHFRPLPYVGGHTFDYAVYARAIEDALRAKNSEEQA